MKLSVIIPVYNESRTVIELMGRVLAADVAKEVIVVDDGSTDATPEKLQSVTDPRVRVILQERNRGKGCAVRRGIDASTGDAVILQDADLEYDPQDYRALLDAMREEGAAVVYGNRQHPGNREHSYWRYTMGGMVVTMVTNFLYGTTIHDEPTCYKLFDGDLIRRLRLRCTGFEFCPEVTAIVRRLGYRIVERPIRYRPRKREEGKKINWKDGVIALWTLWRYRWKPERELLAEKTRSARRPSAARCGSQLTRGRPSTWLRAGGDEGPRP